MDAYQGLGDWVHRIGLNLLALDELEDEDGFEPDFTGASLEGLELALLAHVSEPDDTYDPGHRRLIDGAAGYLGEVLLRQTGGAWGWRGGEPLVRADKALALPPAFPLQLIARAIQERTEHEFADVYAVWQAAVARHQVDNPRWTPTKTRTPGVDPFEMSPADAAHIAAWVAERRGAFSQWARTYGADVAWDFRPASLDALENLLARITPTTGELRDPGHRDFVEGAVWYFGEVVRRIRGGTWGYRTQDPTAPNAYAGDPYVQQAGEDDDFVMPIVMISDFVRNRVAGTLREEYERCAGEDTEVG